MSRYELRVHSIDLEREWMPDNFQHTGYSLIEYDENNNPIKIQTLDLIPINNDANVNFRIAEESLAILDSNGYKSNIISLS